MKRSIIMTYWYTLLLCTMTAMTQQVMRPGEYTAQEAAEARQAEAAEARKKAEEKADETVRNKRLARQAEGQRQREALEARLTAQRQNRMSPEQRTFNETKATLDQQQREENAARQRSATQEPTVTQKHISIKAEKDIIQEREDQAREEEARAKADADLARVEKEKARLAQQESDARRSETGKDLKQEEPTAQAPQSDTQAPKATAKEYKSGSFGEWINRIIDWIFNSHAKHTNTSIQQMWDNNNTGAKQDVEWIADKVKNDPKEKSEVISAMKTKAQDMYESIKNDPQKVANFESFFNKDVLSTFDVKMSIKNGKVVFELYSEVLKNFTFNSLETIEQNIQRLQNDIPRVNKEEMIENMKTILSNQAKQFSSNNLLSYKQKTTLACEALGIDPKGKTLDQLKKDATKAFRTKSVKWHPDRNPDKTGITEAEFKVINEAYQFIKDLE